MNWLFLDGSPVTEIPTQIIDIRSFSDRLSQLIVHQTESAIVFANRRWNIRKHPDERKRSNRIRDLSRFGAKQRGARPKGNNTVNGA